MSPAEVRAATDRLGYHVRYRGGCHGVPPVSGRVVSQTQSGGPFHKNLWLIMDISSVCANATAERLCATGDLHLSVDGGGSYYAGTAGQHIEYFDLTNKSERPCQLKATATLSVAGLSGELAPLRGNPTEEVISYRLEPGESFTGTWIWNNWCQLHHRWLTTVTVAGLEAHGISGSPMCQKRLGDPILAIVL